MTREELRDYVEEQRNLNIIPYHVYSTLIDGIDTLEQQPEIIRCKDCKQFRRWVDTDITFCDLTESPVFETDFCSRAEIEVTE